MKAKRNNVPLVQGLSARLEFDMVAFTERAREGTMEKNQAQAILKYFCLTVRGGKQISQDVLDYLAGVFEVYLDGTQSEIEKALGLKRKKAGNPGSVSGKRRLTSSGRIELARRISDLMDSGASHEDAVDQARAEAGVSRNTAAQCYRELREKVAGYMETVSKWGGDDVEAINRASEFLSVSEAFVIRAAARNR
ncbi:hypothetical protein AWB69_00027 [Caballeronia udeis]|uniref:Uncharacterized protein n=1 Tax=Caballeronia udeis TaxID=1232866 RepID=A0A158EP65_9BURK|nr:hypothetical protein [Caballeronia udeis]SAL09358.1 hypothetical protein AWB69_00027 [Caballeronia udeis]